MDEEKLKSIETQIKQKYGKDTIKGIIGEIIIEDIRAFVAENKRMPEAKDIIDGYEKLPNFYNILGLTDLDNKWLEKFVGIFLKADIEDFQVAEV
jgi:hypothetical protein